MIAWINFIVLLLATILFAFLCNSPFLALYSIIWLPLFHLMSRAEERDLLIRYGDNYKAYMKSTGMYFPKRRLALVDTPKRQEGGLH
jgi:protein-S-isoprenylcysteine O-methyltransferase Ste14